MRISTKGRYGLATMIMLAKKGGNHTAIDVSNYLGISKIYMEQVFSLLKKAELVQSQKGSLGGYSLAKEASSITAYDILKATESALFEQTQISIASKNSTDIESILSNHVWVPIDLSIKNLLTSKSLEDMLIDYNDNMFYI